MDSKFDRLIDKVDENRRELKDDMKHQTTITISVIGAITTVIGGYSANHTSLYLRVLPRTLIIFYLF